MRRWIIVSIVLVLAICLLAGGLVASGASFSSSSQSSINVSSVAALDLAHGYSFASDPQGWAGYYRRPDNNAWAATGVDHSLTVNVGGQPLKNEKLEGLFTIQAASPLPSGITSITVRATLLPDAGGVQPISKIGFASLGGNGRQNPTTLTAGQKVQCNVAINLPKPNGRTYTSTIVLTITYSGYTGTYYQYSVPFRVTAGPGGALDIVPDDGSTTTESTAVTDDTTVTGDSGATPPDAGTTTPASALQ